MTNKKLIVFYVLWCFADVGNSSPIETKNLNNKMCNGSCETDIYIGPIKDNQNENPPVHIRHMYPSQNWQESQNAEKLLPVSEKNDNLEFSLLLLKVTNPQREPQKYVNLRFKRNLSKTPDNVSEDTYTPEETQHNDYIHGVPRDVSNKSQEMIRIQNDPNFTEDMTNPSYDTITPFENSSKTASQYFIDKTVDTKNNPEDTTVTFEKTHNNIAKDSSTELSSIATTPKDSQNTLYKINEKELPENTKNKIMDMRSNDVPEHAYNSLLGGTTISPFKTLPISFLHNLNNKPIETQKLPPETFNTPGFASNTPQEMKSSIESAISDSTSLDDFLDQRSKQRDNPTNVFDTRTPIRKPFNSLFPFSNAFNNKPVEKQKFKDTTNMPESRQPNNPSTNEHTANAADDLSISFVNSPEQGPIIRNTPPKVSTPFGTPNELESISRFKDLQHSLLPLTHYENEKQVETRKLTDGTNNTPTAELATTIVDGLPIQFAGQYAKPGGVHPEINNPAELEVPFNMRNTHISGVRNALLNTFPEHTPTTLVGTTNTVESFKQLPHTQSNFIYGKPAEARGEFDDTTTMHKNAAKNTPYTIDSWFPSSNTFVKPKDTQNTVQEINSPGETLNAKDALVNNIYSTSVNNFPNQTSDTTNTLEVPNLQLKNPQNLGSPILHSLSYAKPVELRKSPHDLSKTLQNTADITTTTFENARPALKEINLPKQLEEPPNPKNNQINGVGRTLVGDVQTPSTLFGTTDTLEPDSPYKHSPHLPRILNTFTSAPKDTQNIGQEINALTYGKHDTYVNNIPINNIDAFTSPFKNSHNSGFPLLNSLSEERRKLPDDTVNSSGTTDKNIADDLQTPFVRAFKPTETQHTPREVNSLLESKEPSNTRKTHINDNAYEASTSPINIISTTESNSPFPTPSDSLLPLLSSFNDKQFETRKHTGETTLTAKNPAEVRTNKFDDLPTQFASSSIKPENVWKNSQQINPSNEFEAPYNIRSTHISGTQSTLVDIIPDTSPSSLLDTSNRMESLKHAPYSPFSSLSDLDEKSAETQIAPDDTHSMPSSTDKHASTNNFVNNFPDQTSNTMVQTTNTFDNPNLLFKNSQNSVLPLLHSLNDDKPNEERNSLKGTDNTAGDLASLLAGVSIKPEDSRNTALKINPPEELEAPSNTRTTSNKLGTPFKNLPLSILPSLYSDKDNPVELSNAPEEKNDTPKNNDQKSSTTFGITETLDTSDLSLKDSSNSFTPLSHSSHDKQFEARNLLVTSNYPKDILGSEVEKNRDVAQITGNTDGDSSTVVSNGPIAPKDSRDTSLKLPVQESNIKSTHINLHDIKSIADDIPNASHVLDPLGGRLSTSKNPMSLSDSYEIFDTFTTFNTLDNILKRLDHSLKMLDGKLSTPLETRKAAEDIHPAGSNKIINRDIQVIPLDMEHIFEDNRDDNLEYIKQLLDELDDKIRDTPLDQETIDESQGENKNVFSNNKYERITPSPPCPSMFRYDHGLRGSDTDTDTDIDPVYPIYDSDDFRSSYALDGFD